MSLQLSDEQKRIQRNCYHLHLDRSTESGIVLENDPHHVWLCRDCELKVEVTFRYEQLLDTTYGDDQILKANS